MQARREGPETKDLPIIADIHGHIRVADLEHSVFITTEPMQVPGIVSGVPYSNEDAVGQPFGIQVPPNGIIMSAQLIDTDDNEINRTILLFDASFSATADNSPFVLARDDYPKLIHPIKIQTFLTLNGDVIGYEENVNVPYSVPEKVLHAQIITQGAPNFAANTGLWVSLGIWTRATMH